MKHILNIAFDFDDDKIKEYLEKEAEQQVIESIKKDILEIFKSKDLSRWSRDSERGLELWIGRIIDNYIVEWKDDIIFMAADKLAERLSRSKRGKELLTKYEEAEK